MKRVLIFLGLMIATILSGCLNEEERKEVKSLERAAKKKMEAFLKDEFGEYKILEYEQYVEIGFLENNYISDITEFSVKIDGEKYVFAYCADSDTYWSDYYYDEVFAELEDELSDYGILGEAYNHSIKINGDNVWRLEENLILYEDKTLDDIKEENKKNRTYLIECCYYFDNKDNFNPTDLGLDCVYDDFLNVRLKLFNTAGDYYDPAYVLDKVEYEESDYDEYYIYVGYSHRKLVSVNGRYFSYDDNFYDVNITPIDYDVDDPERTTFPGVDFKRMGDAYEIEVEQLVEIESTQTKSSFINENGIEVKVTYDDYLDLSIYLESDIYENKYIYNSHTEKMDNIYRYGDGSYSEKSFVIRDMYNESFVVALYEKID